MIPVPMIPVLESKYKIGKPRQFNKIPITIIDLLPVSNSCLKDARKITGQLLDYDNVQVFVE